jgi:hypothetical protein
MFLDAAVAIIAVRTTARISAVLLAANLVATARRLWATTPAEPDTNRTPTLLSGLVSRVRTIDVATFAAFLVSHTIHFASVALLALATDGSSIRNTGGWTPAMVVATLFYVGCWGVLRAKQRPTNGWVGTHQRILEMSVLAIVWTVFFLGFLGRSTGSPLFLSLTIALVFALVLFTVAGVRSPIARAGPGTLQSV